MVCTFLPFEWKMAIVEASKGKSGATLNKVLNFCFTYDPVGQAYVLNITKLGGIIIMFFATILLLFLV
jgi:protein SCO1